MKTIRYSPQYKKDFKRYRHQPDKVDKLMAVLELLASGERLPPELCAHKLTGRYKGCLECHIENDFLLIWEDESENCIYVLRLGSHSELFRR